MSKLPPVQRPYLSDTGLTGESAYLWAVFLANEADMADDYIAYDKWKAAAETLAPAKGKATPAAVHYPILEEAIKTYGIC